MKFQEKMIRILLLSKFAQHYFNQYTESDPQQQVTGSQLLQPQRVELWNDHSFIDSLIHSFTAVHTYLITKINCKYF